jgi:uncharacterized surface protein with fasciclin (FAS1) repeats
MYIEEIRMRRSITAVLALSVLLTLVPAVSANGGSRGTITDIVAASGGEFDGDRTDYDILLNAVLVAGLADALDDASATYTTFAPNDRAFIRTARDLGFTGTGEAGAWSFLVTAFTQIGGGDPIPVLTNVLLYHVAPGYYRPVRVLFSKQIPTLLPNKVIRPWFLSLRDYEPDLPNPLLVLKQINIKADNGVIHTINRVLIPVDL